MRHDAAALANRAERRPLCRDAGAGLKRPGGETAWRNLVLAGDWTDTGLPATIEGAIRSGNHAAELIAAAKLNSNERHDPKKRDGSRPPHRGSDRCTAGDCSAPTDIFCSSWRPTPPFRPNTCCCAIISASRSTPRWKQKIAVYLRRIQGAHGGWPLFRDGEFDMSATVKAYFALKMIGDQPQAPHMHRAREAIWLRGGAERANVFTRCLLALYGIVPWRAVPEMPVEIMLLPKWFPFHLDKISYWSRTVIVPLLVLMAKKPRAVNAKGIAYRRAVS